MNNVQYEIMCNVFIFNIKNICIGHKMYYFVVINFKKYFYYFSILFALKLQEQKGIFVIPEYASETITMIK